MNKVELIERIAATTDSSKRSTERFLNAFLAEVEGALANGEDVRLTDFGHFEVYTKKGAKYRNVHTGELAFRPAKQSLRFTTGKRLKDRVEGSKIVQDADLPYGEV